MAVLFSKSIENTNSAITNNSFPFPIDTEEKAIAYAKTDPDVNVFVNEWKNGVEFWAYKNDSNWKVEIVPVRKADIAFGILFNQDGGIISKGREGGM